MLLTANCGVYRLTRSFHYRPGSRAPLRQTILPVHNRSRSGQTTKDDPPKTIKHNRKHERKKCTSKNINGIKRHSPRSDRDNWEPSSLVTHTHTHTHTHTYLHTYIHTCWWSWTLRVNLNKLTAVSPANSNLDDLHFVCQRSHIRFFMSDVANGE